ncbi:hypothetical protein CLAFUW4_10461 [Fulvia fulva]|uniref:RING-type E3 ubiquitin transferase n=1 Tax=Passalora fulva TaxID=5499 RepID=A0A9Q8P7Y0_PASFU|nr:uncharacterized protein CLAFUR5_05077 [Fulvia fulva]KAK4615715.1 hypothetical protein CLAFUR4_10465 [Fulvia fulva]KAK4616778.1 hypothetical protein CLAFUR0_10466 [Fulvia fulva]UJO16620.1 hypothetical protein CLAFUR5_05077 [Fulvia fulva]WPV19068.1 hypothetical protein CLAFUW4_10461 [Fulvia fulva]WPV34179.1 hypothetical protein CLAFUW7_10461 [Fulvia fulva]
MAASPKADFHAQLEPESCPICCKILSQPTKTECGHLFCLPCLLHWTESCHTCPSCQDPLYSESAAAADPANVNWTACESEYNSIERDVDALRASVAALRVHAIQRERDTSTERESSPWTSTSRQQAELLVRARAERQGAEESTPLPFEDRQELERLRKVIIRRLGGSDAGQDDDEASEELSINQVTALIENLRTFDRAPPASSRQPQVQGAAASNSSPPIRTSDTARDSAPLSAAEVLRQAMPLPPLRVEVVHESVTVLRPSSPIFYTR